MSRIVLLALWATAAAMLLLCVVGSLSSRRPVAPFTKLIDSVTSTVPTFAIVLVVWAWAGWHFFAR